MDRFNILQFCAGDILQSTTCQQNLTLSQHRDSNIYHVTETQRRISPIHLLVESNALFSQVSEILQQNDSDNIIEDSIIYITFKRSFKGNSSLFRNKKMGRSADELYKNGLTIQYSNGKKVHYVPSERSGSMAKKCTLSFVDVSIAKQLDQRILLDLDLVGQYPLSKLQAYKGLMLSQGISVGIAKSLGLNSSSVIVVDDYKVPYPDTNYISLQKNQDTWERIECQHTTDNKTIDSLLSPYDGVGLIDQAFAKSINTQYGATKDLFNISKYNKSSSYQVRMPFVKGMLHSCNFNHFFQSHIGDGKITDYFGKEHDYNDVKIILTKSQFKLLSIVKKEQYTSYIGNDDIWQYYWDKVHQYNHQLFITEIDPPRKKQFMQTNTQLMRTPNMNYQQFCQLKSGTANLYRQLVSNHTARIDYVKYASKDNILSNNLGNGRATTVAGKLVTKNNLFVHYKPIRTQLTDATNSIKNNYAEGKFFIRGENRYLSGDLLLLLYNIIGMPCPEQEQLDVHSFYAPDSNMYSNGQPYVLLRNPHLTRNEDGMLLARTYDDNSERQWLFGHLQMVVMVNALSTISDRLGGADYDGDRVAIVADDTYIQAVKSHHEQIEHNGKIIYRNKYPLLLIPSLPPLMGSINADNNLDTVKRTFSLNIGQYNNMATKHAINAYNANANISEELQKKCADNAECISILTQLEIDSAKSGADIVIPEDMQSTYTVGLYDESDLLRYLKDGNYATDEQPASHSPNLAYLPYLAKPLDDNTDIEYVQPMSHKTTAPRNLHAQLFDLETDNIDNDLMLEVSNLYEKYNKALHKMHAFKDTSTNIYLDAISDILWLQGKENTSTAQNAIHTALAKLGFLQLTTIIRAMQNHQWHFLPMEERVQLLSHHNLCELIDNADSCSLLCDFSHSGYMLLYYFIQHCIANKLYHIMKDNTNLEGEVDDDQQQESITATEKKNRLIAECQEELLFVFRDCFDDTKEALRYCIANKQIRDSNFIWELLGECMIDYAKEGSHA